MRAAPVVLALALAAAACASAPIPAPRSAPDEEGIPAGAEPAPAAGTKALGLFPSNRGVFDDFARPVTNMFFHTPFIRNEVRPVYLHHRLPERSLVQGGTMDVVGSQLNLAISERVGLSIYKGGYADFDSGAMPRGKGFADLAGGVKWEFWENREARWAAAALVGYEEEHEIGDPEVLAGMGGGLFDLAGTVAHAVGPVHLVGTAGLLMPRDPSMNTRAIHWHAHADVEAFGGFSPLLEVNGWHYLSDAHRNAGLPVPIGLEGFDYGNFGSGGVKGDDVIVVGLGFRVGLLRDLSLGAAYEVPISMHEHVFRDRITVDLTFRF